MTVAKLPDFLSFSLLVHGVRLLVLTLRPLRGVNEIMYVKPLERGQAYSVYSVQIPLLRSIYNNKGNVLIPSLEFL